MFNFFRMGLELVLLMCTIARGLCLRLGPLENNDKLQDVTKLYVAEWQWESWPVKQDPTEQEGRTPGLRKNFALWRDNSKSAWYLYGGQSVSDPKKVYSDVWKFTIKTRIWKKFFPSQSKMKSAYTDIKGGPNTAQSVLIDEKDASYFEPASDKIVLCGGSEKKNRTRTKFEELWGSFRRKKFEEKVEDELSYLAIHAQKTSKSNTIWQVDVAKKIWTNNICSFNNEKLTPNSSIEQINKTDIQEPSINVTSGNKTTVDVNQAKKNECAIFDAQINKAEDKVDNEQQNFNIDDLKNKRRKINKFKKENEKPQSKVVSTEKVVDSKKEKDVNETKLSPTYKENLEKNKTLELVNNSDTDIKIKKKNFFKRKNTTENSEEKQETQKTGKIQELKLATECPKLTDDGAHTTWCDKKNEAFVTVDVSSSQFKLWVYDLKKKFWSQIQVKNCDGIDWSSCANTNSIRFAGNDEEVYIICSQSQKQPDLTEISLNATQAPETPSQSSFNTKLVYKVNYRERVLQSFGKIKLNPYFNSVEGEKIWQNDTLSILKIVKNSENETILILAYLDVIDLWILNKDQERDQRFDLIEKIWRGSALKWFDKYNAVLYSLQFVSESGSSEIILLPNPRNIGANDYWPRERGRFIIRIFRNENLKNESFENRTKEQNLTYELLQSDYKPPRSENRSRQMYSLKVITFFGISLTMFAVFGFVVFLKKCVNCPRRIQIRNEYHKSPLVIRYSVIPDDLLYPVT